jgi:serine/threonine protein kinase
MTMFSEAIQDFKLNTVFEDDGVYHIYDDCDSSTGQRVLKRRERWKRISHLGSGGFGTVWLESCVAGRGKGQQRAVKDLQCPRRHIDFSRELEALATFSRGLCARWFCQSFGWYEREDKIYLTMEYFPLGDLQHYITKLPEPIPEADAQQITLQVFEGLDFMHKRNFAHRDIKPGVCSGPLSTRIIQISNAHRTSSYSLIHHEDGGSKLVTLVSANDFGIA